LHNFITQPGTASTGPWASRAGRPLVGDLCVALTKIWGDEMEVDIKLAKEAIYWRGLFVMRYAGVEFAIAELVSRASIHPAYLQLGVPPFGPAKKLKRLLQIIDLRGPIADFRDELKPMLEDFALYSDNRNFLVHGIMVPQNENSVLFQMYDHREGVYSIGELHFELRHLEAIAKMIGTVSSQFTSLVARICRQIPLAEI
jgi:hypothetical protein